MIKSDRKEIEKLIGEHLIAWFMAGGKALKGYYHVTPENLADFIDRFFVRRDKEKPWSKVLSDSRLAPKLEGGE